MTSLKEKLIAKIFEQNISEETLVKALSVFEPQVETTQEASQEFMSEEQTLNFCGGISRSTLWLWRKAGLKSYQVGGRRLFLPDDVKTFIMSETYKLKA